MKAHPIFARCYDRLARAAAPIEDPLRTEMLDGISGRVLEVGVGPGINFHFYPEGVEVVAAEPEPNMMRRAVQRAAEAPVPVRLVRASAERLPFADASFDVVVLSLVMCSVADPRAAAQEVRRVVRQGGEVRLFEHVRSAHPGHARWQRRLTPLWKPFAGGCNLHRDTGRTLEEAGFQLEVRRVPVGPPTPARPHIVGVARPA